MTKKVETKTSVRIVWLSGDTEDFECSMKESDQIASVFMRSKFCNKAEVVCTHEKTELTVHNNPAAS